MNLTEKQKQYPACMSANMTEDPGCWMAAGHIKSGEFEDVIEIGTDEDGNTIELNLVLDPEYLMGDFVEGYDTVPEPYISVTVIDDGGLWFMCEPADVEAHCGAKIVSYEYDEPIKNSFGK